jgi:polysaccharide pyruvyl transferase WcaK-like protein
MTLFTSWNAYLPWIEEQIAIAFGERRPVLVIGENNRHELGTADIGIAYRLHAAASLLLAGVPTLVVRYESKCLDFLAHLGLQDLVLDPDAGGMEKLRDVLLGELTPWIAEQADRVPEAVGRAKEQVEERFSEFLECLRMTTGARPGE